MPTKHMVKIDINTSLTWELTYTESGTVVAYCTILPLTVEGDDREDAIEAAKEAMELLWKVCEEDGSTLQPT